MPSTPWSIAIFVISIDSEVEYDPVPAIMLALSPTASFAVQYNSFLSSNYKFDDSPVVPYKTSPSDFSWTNFLHNLQKVSVLITPLLSNGVITAVRISPKSFMPRY